MGINPLNTELNPTCRMLEVLGAHHILKHPVLGYNCTNWNGFVTLAFQG